MPKEYSKISTCFVCGAPIYVEIVSIVYCEEKENKRKQPPILTKDTLRGDNGLPVNFFTCDCRKPKILAKDSDA